MQVQAAPSTVVQPTTQLHVVPNPVVVGQSHICENYAHKQAIMLGIAQIVVGFLCVIIQIAATVIDAYASDPAVGVWCGVPYIITGVLGILSGKMKTRSMVLHQESGVAKGDPKIVTGFTMITACMVMSIVTAVFFVLPLLIASSVGFTQDKDKNYCNIFLLEISTCPPNSDKEAKVGLNVFLLILSLVEFFATVWASSLCCGVLCCGATETAGQIITTTTLVVPGQVQTVPAGQQLVVAQQPAGTVVYPAVQQPNMVMQPYAVQARQAQGGQTASVSSVYHEYSEIANPPPVYSQYEQPTDATKDTYTPLS